MTEYSWLNPVSTTLYSTTRLSMRKRKYDQLRWHGDDLPWLPIPQRIVYKLCTNKCLHQNPRGPNNLSEISVRRLMTNCLIRFWAIQYTFYISSRRVSASQNHTQTSDHTNTMKYRTKQHIWLNAISWTECYLLTCILTLVHFTPPPSVCTTQRSVCCLINEYEW